MTMHYQKSDPIILGSGELYLCLASDIANPENVTPEEEGKFLNIGAIESGATVDISSEYQEVKTQNRGTVARFKTDSEVRFSTGICTWNMENMAKFLTGSHYEEDDLEGTKKMIIGRNDNSPNVYLRFVHTKKDGSGELIVNVFKCAFDGDLSFVFENENPVSINYEFAAMTTQQANYVEFIEKAI